MCYTILYYICVVLLARLVLFVYFIRLKKISLRINGQKYYHSTLHINECTFILGRLSFWRKVLQTNCESNLAEVNIFNLAIQSDFKQPLYQVFQNTTTKAKEGQIDLTS